MYTRAFASSFLFLVIILQHTLNEKINLSFDALEPRLKVMPQLIDAPIHGIRQQFVSLGLDSRHQARVIAGHLADHEFAITAVVGVPEARLIAPFLIPVKGALRVSWWTEPFAFVDHSRAIKPRFLVTSAQPDILFQLLHKGFLVRRAQCEQRHAKIATELDARIEATS